MAKDDRSSITDPMPLADVYRHIMSLGRTPEDAKRAIFDDMETGRLPHRVRRILIYWRAPAKTEVRVDQPIPTEVLKIGIAGRGSLRTNRLNSKAVRAAGAAWPRMELEGIHVSRQIALTLYQPIEKAPESATEAPNRRKVGRKPEYDWGALNSECMRRLHDDGEPDNYSDLGRDLLEWYGKQFGPDNEPDFVTLKPYLKRWIGDFKRSLPRRN